jgi:ceramide synthetase
MFPAYYIFNFLLSILLVLHVIWTYYIFKILYKAVYSDKVTTLLNSAKKDNFCVV